MTNEQINIAIAEACGWIVDTSSGRIEDPSGVVYYAFDKLPNWCNDLNAMHEAEKVLTMEQLYMFSKKLDILMDRAPRRFGNNMPWAAHKVTATAAQRAEAFLQVFGKMEGKTK